MGAVLTPVDLERVPGARPIPWGSCFWPQARRLRSQSREPRPPSSGIFRRADALWAVRARCASTLEQNISVRVRKRSKTRLHPIFFRRYPFPLSSIPARYGRLVLSGRGRPGGLPSGSGEAAERRGALFRLSGGGKSRLRGSIRDASLETWVTPNPLKDCPALGH
jgi:hypothetical protein